MFKRTERRDCEFCGRETEHSVERIERVKNPALPIVKNVVTCTCCNAVYTEKRIIVAR